MTTTLVGDLKKDDVVEIEGRRLTVVEVDHITSKNSVFVRFAGSKYLTMQVHVSRTVDVVGTVTSIIQDVACAPLSPVALSEENAVSRAERTYT